MAVVRLPFEQAHGNLARIGHLEEERTASALAEAQQISEK
jgi:hypothetical protein